MSPAYKRNCLITLAGELCLFSAALMLGDVILRGVSLLGVVVPIAFTLTGVLLLSWGLRKARS